MVIRIEATPEQAQNWIDFRYAESILPKNSSIPVWHAVDIIRLRRKGYKYSEIIMMTGYNANTVRRVSQLSGLGRKYRRRNK